MARNQPHSALRWIARCRTFSGRNPWADRESDAAIAALAWLRLNSARRAAETLDAVAMPSDQFERTRAALETLSSCQRGDLAAVNRLTGDFFDRLPPQAIFEAVVRCAQFNGRFDLARAVADDWQRQFPQDAAAAYQRGRNAELTERLPEALQAYRDALALQPDLPRAAFRSGVLLARERGPTLERDFELAADLFRSCSGSECGEIAAIEVANCLWELQQTDRAWEVLQPIIARRPGSLVDAYLEVDEYVEEDRVAIVASRIAESRGDDPLAIDLLERALAHNPRNFEAVGRLAVILRRCGRDDQAESRTTDHQRMLQQRERAVAIRTRLVERPDDIDARFELAVIYFDIESLADTQLELSEVLKRDSDHAGAKKLLVEVARQWSRMRSDPGQSTLSEVATKR